MSTVALLVAVVKAPWAQWRSRPERQHALFAAVLGLALFWQLKVSISGLLALHPLVMMTVVMVFGPSLGMITGALALGLATLLAGAPWLPLGPQMLLTVVVPALAAQGVLKVVERVPGRNLFVYMLGGGFLGAMVTVQAMALATWCYVRVLGPAPLLVDVASHYYLTLLMMFPEGFINGALVSMLTVFRPELVRTYDDHHYLDGH
ncbi:hypothetical protein HBA55_16990 [Pseudomaricurvus alkylphenolicus]|nr:hypothetical protein [Pseudomaricurvus alkylphenolicus]